MHVEPPRILRELVVRSLWLPALVLAVHFVLALGLDIYRRVPDIDVAAHFIGGFSIAYAAARALEILHRARVVPSVDGSRRAATLLLVTCLAAILWEMGEFAADNLFGARTQPSAGDTARDVSVGIVGCGAYLAARLF
ncbi:MAG: hypothetical protein KBD01_08435 [Acidobacteria bacterium]|nr:hypothetical protein [Acidobacteriota bacterium]